MLCDGISLNFQVSVSEQELLSSCFIRRDCNLVDKNYHEVIIISRCVHVFMGMLIWCYGGQSDCPSDVLQVSYIGLQHMTSPC